MLRPCPKPCSFKSMQAEFWETPNTHRSSTTSKSLIPWSRWCRYPCTSATFSRGDGISPQRWHTDSERYASHWNECLPRMDPIRLHVRSHKTSVLTNVEDDQRHESPQNAKGSGSVLIVKWFANMLPSYLLTLGILNDTRFPMPDDSAMVPPQCDVWRILNPSRTMYGTVILKVLPLCFLDVYLCIRTRAQAVLSYT